MVGEGGVVAVCLTVQLSDRLFAEMIHFVLESREPQSEVRGAALHLSC